ncbi:hypothetical protein PVAND_009178 [Polypedilum vanderplanki]|uniref:Uncharacterized protein n=1 Tax=Polypedilum vanderplanki TaxID=319348 RepID=A0A9J6CC36_POLVA|nr:hypothetical protein PVAND_009178 [Polypedilum vanderplanki]
MLINSSKQNKQRKRQKEKKARQEIIKNEVKANSTYLRCDFYEKELPVEYFKIKFDLEDSIKKTNFKRAANFINANPWYEQLIHFFIKKCQLPQHEALLILGNNLLSELFPQKRVIEFVTSELLKLPVKQTFFASYQFYKRVMEKKLINVGLINTIKNQFSILELDSFTLVLASQNEEFVNHIIKKTF